MMLSRSSRCRRALLLCASVALFCSAPVAAKDWQVDLEVKAGKLVAGPKSVRLVRDDIVRITVVADRADELHLHGYNLERKIVAGQPATLEFVARRTGRFTLELHKSGAELTVFEIYPK